MGMPAGAPHSRQNWASGCCSSCLAELPPFSGWVGCPQWTQKLTSRFSYGFPIFWVQLPLPFLDISPVEAALLHTFFSYSRIFCCRLWRLRMPSRQDEKGGDGMSISAYSVTLAAWSRSVKSGAGCSVSGCSAFGLPVGSTAAVSLGHQSLFPHRSVWKVWEAAALPCR